MALFLSTYVNKLDKKGRVSVPAQFRSALTNQSFPGIVAFRSCFLTAIEAFGIDRMEKLSQEVDTMDILSQKQDSITASIFADSHMLQFDQDGRVVLPEILIQHANLSGDIAFVGRGPSFQIWEPEMFKTHQEEARQSMKSQSVHGA